MSVARCNEEHATFLSPFYVDQYYYEKLCILYLISQNMKLIFSSYVLSKSILYLGFVPPAQTHLLAPAAASFLCSSKLYLLQIYLLH